MAERELTNGEPPYRSLPYIKVIQTESSRASESFSLYYCSPYLWEATVDAGYTKETGDIARTRPRPRC